MNYKEINSLINNELFKHDLTLELDEYCCGTFNGKPFRLSCYDELDFITDDNFDRFANSEYISFSIRSKKGLKQLVAFIKENTSQD